MTIKMMNAVPAFLVSCMVSTVALASEDVLPSADTQFTKWGEESGWTIYVNPDHKSCLIERVDANMNVIQMGLTKDHSLGYVGVFTRADVGVSKKGEPVGLLLDGEAFYGVAHPKTKHLADGYTGGYILTDNPAFVEAVMKKHVMSVFPEHQNAFDVSLDGTNNAIEAARKCNAEQGGS